MAQHDGDTMYGVEKEDGIFHMHIKAKASQFWQSQEETAQASQKPLLQSFPFSPPHSPPKVSAVCSSCM